MEALKVSQITKKYGRQTILDDISLTIQPGKIYGLLGRNGAGKSTLLNLIVNRILQPAARLNWAMMRSMTMTRP